MCKEKKCNCPDFVELHSQINDAIAKGEWKVIAVSADCDDEPNFAYSVGLHSMGQPELFIMGRIPVTLQGAILNDVAQDFKDGKVTLGVNKDYLNTVSGLMPIKLVELDTERAVLHDNYTVQLFTHYPNEKQLVRVVQIYWPDANGNFPDSIEWEGGVHQCLMPIESRKQNTLH